MIRLKTHILVNAWVRRCQAGGAFAMVLRKGDEDAGQIALRLYQPGKPVRILMETRDMDGNKVWRDITKGGVDEQEADRLLARETGFDRDLWILEVEDRDGRSFVDEPVIDG